MKRHVRGLVGPVLVAALIASALNTSSAVSQVNPELPSLPVDQLLSMARVEVPPSGVSLEVHIDFPAEDPFQIDDVAFTALTAIVHPDRTVDMQSAVAAESADGTTQAEECEDPTFLPSGKAWSASDMPVRWSFRRGSTPEGNSVLRTQAALRDAHKVWPASRSRCTQQDSIGFAYEFAGGTKKTVKYDRANIIEFGPLTGEALAINYTWFSGTRILETDLRMNRSGFEWTNRPGGRKYLVSNVAAHELGHQVGLDDLGDPHGGLTMFGRIYRGESKKLTLGTGDLRGADRLSP